MRERRTRRPLVNGLVVIGEAGNVKVMPAAPASWPCDPISIMAVALGRPEEAHESDMPMEAGPGPSALLQLEARSATPSVASLGSVRHVPEEYPTIQAAVDASRTGDTVLLGPGTYTGPGNRDIEFHGVDLIVTSEGGPEETIIDCERAGRGFYLHEGETRAARIEGLTIRNGYRYEYPAAGGAILCFQASPTIANCRLLWNESRMEGGALALLIFDGVVEECIVAGNYAAGATGGGGVCARFSGSGEIIHCLIYGNWGSPGGGICFDGDTSVRMRGCTIAGNLATHGGGVSADLVLRLERCIVWDNCAFLSGDEIECAYGAFTCCDIDTTGIEATGTLEYIDGLCQDPLFCDPYLCGWMDQGDWSLDAASSCLPQNSPCGELIGALGQGCGITPAVETTWGAIKAMYRQ